MTQTNLHPNAKTNTDRAWCVYSPDVDVYESDDAFLVVADLPGVAPDRIGLDLNDGVLSLSAELNNGTDSQTTYRRQWKLASPVDPDQITAEAKAGELTVRIAKSTQARKRHIEIHAS